MKTQILLSTLLVIGSTQTANAFVPRTSRFAVKERLVLSSPPARLILREATNDDPPILLEATNDDTPENKFVMPEFDLPKVDFSDFGDAVTKSLGNLSNFGDNFDQIKANVMEGEFLKRGEEWFATQAFLVLCIIFGGVPVIGNTLMLLGGPGLLLAGVYVLLVSVSDMGGSLSPWLKPPASPESELITSGLFAKMRHPVYSGLLSTMAGLSLLSGSADRLLLTGILFYVLDVKSAKEEQAMLEQYGSDYSNYMVRPNLLLKLIFNLPCCVLGI
jgi:protein-S-isoprenylcysteine O-methyltransferase Ste14